VLAVATGALPVKCLATGTCGPAAKVVAPEPLPDSQLTPVAPQKQVAAVTPAPLAKAGPSLTNNDVLAGTFGQLTVKSPAADPAASAPTRVASTPSASTVPKSVPTTELKTLKVRTVTINPDGTPVLPEPLSSGDPVAVQAYAAEPAPAPAAAAAEQITQVAVATPEAPTPVARPAKAMTADSGKFKIVAGSGANVRSSPSKGGSKVLFALAPGEKVKVGDNQRGWIRVTDDQGRTGWVYKDYLH